MTYANDAIREIVELGASNSTVLYVQGLEALIAKSQKRKEAISKAYGEMRKSNEILHARILFLQNQMAMTDEWKHRVEFNSNAALIGTVTAIRDIARDILAQQWDVPGFDPRAPGACDRTLALLRTLAQPEG